MEFLQAIARITEEVSFPPQDRAKAQAGAATALKVIDNIDGLSSYMADLEDLAGDLEVQNVAYEPWILFPILRACADRRRLLFVLIFDENSALRTRLVGFFPFERTVLHPFAPLSCLRLWADPFNYLNARCDPLIRKGYLTCIDAVLDWFMNGTPRATLLNLRGLTGGASVSQGLKRCLEKRPRLTFAHSITESHLYRRQQSADSYFAAIFSRKSLQTLRRYERRLGDLGLVEYAEVARDPDIRSSVDEFLDLENRGWKGKQGVSVISYGHRELIKGILNESHRRGRLSLLTLRVGGKLVAARCVILARPGSFLFKLTYDESEAFARRSPGLLLELEAIRRMHSDRVSEGLGIDWMDTCASPRSSIFTRSRSESLKVHRFLIARNRSAGALALLAIPKVWKFASMLQGVWRGTSLLFRTSRA